MVNKYESCVSENLGQVFDLGPPIEDWSLMSSSWFDVVKWTSAHQQSNNKSQNCCDDLKSFCVLDVSEAEVERQEPENCNSKVIWIPPKPILETFVILPESICDSCHKTFSTAYKFKTDCAIHVDDEDNNDAWSNPGWSKSIGNNTDFNFLTDVKSTLFVVEVDHG